MQANREITFILARSTHLHTKNSGIFYGRYQRGVEFSFCKNFANLGFFAKVSIPV